MITKIILSLLALQVLMVTIYDLKRGTHSGFRRSLDWSTFFLTYLGVMTCYFWWFFPPAVRFWTSSNLTDWEGKMLMSGHITFTLLVIIGFEVAFLLSKRKSDPLYFEKGSGSMKYLAQVLILMALFCLPFFSIVQWRSKPPVQTVVAILPRESKARTPTKVPPLSDPSVTSKITDIFKGGSLCKTLQMTKEEAEAFAKKYGLKYWYEDDGTLFVLVHVGDSFRNVNGEWFPIYLYQHRKSK